MTEKFGLENEKEPSIVKFYRRIDDATFDSKDKFWDLVEDLSYLDKALSRASIAEMVLRRRMDISSELANEIETGIPELSRYDLVISDLNQMPLPNESEYRRILDHLSNSRGISKSLVRQAILQECRMEHDLYELIKSEEHSLPGAFIFKTKEKPQESNDPVENTPQSNVELNIAIVKEKGVVTTDMIDRLSSYMEATEFQTENEILERFDDAIKDAKSIYFNEAKSAGKEGHGFVREVLKALDTFSPSEKSDLVETIMQSVLNELERIGKNGEALRSKEYDDNDKVMNIVGRYIAVALYEKMKK